MVVFPGDLSPCGRWLLMSLRVCFPGSCGGSFAHLLLRVLGPSALLSTPALRAHLPSSALRSCSLHLGDLCCPLCRLLTEGFISFFLHQLDCGPHCLKLSPRSRRQGPAHPGPVKPSVLMEPDSGLSWPSGWTLRALAKGRASKDCLVVVVGFLGGRVSLL